MNVRKAKSLIVCPIQLPEAAGMDHRPPDQLSRRPGKRHSVGWGPAFSYSVRWSTVMRHPAATSGASSRPPTMLPAYRHAGEPSRVAPVRAAPARLGWTLEDSREEMGVIAYEIQEAYPI